MASADAIEDEEWWLRGDETAEVRDESSGGAAKRNRDSETEHEGDVVGTKKNGRKRRRKVDDVIPETEEPFAVLHTSHRQKEVFSSAMQPAPTVKELKFKKSHFTNYRAIEGDGTTPTLSSFARAVCPEWRQWMSGFHTKGSPIMILLTAAATRAVDLRRSLSEFSDGCVVAKLFGKHLKPEEQTTFLASRCTPIAVATPARLQLLVQRGALSLSSVKVLMLDWHWRDQKLRNFLSIPEVWRDFVSVYLCHLHTLVRIKEIKIALF